MPVVSTKELARTYEREITRPMIAKRRWVCVLSDNTTEGTSTTFNEIVTACLGSTNWGLAHPDLTAWKLRKIYLNEGYDGSPYHVEFIAEYGTVRDEEVLSPTSRPAVWSFEGSTGEFPALFYYDSGTQRPLTNSAFDFYPGLMTTESVVLAKVTKNFASFPSSWYSANNCVNSGSYIGCPQHTLRVAGVDATYEYEEFGGAIVRFWKATATLAYRQSGHNLLLPDVGFNFIQAGQKRRAMVFDFDNSEWVPSPNPVGLNGSGGLNTTGHATVLNRRVNDEVDFNGIFGAGPS